MITKEQVEAMEKTAENCGGPVVMTLTEFSTRIGEDPSQYVDKIAFLEHVQQEINEMRGESSSKLVLGLHGKYLVEHVYGSRMAERLPDDVVHWHVLHEGEPYYGSLTERHICPARLKL